MAYFDPRRGCFVNHATNRRYKGLAKALRLAYFPDFEPPPGLGKRVGPRGHRAGLQLDQAVGCVVSGTSTRGFARWTQSLAHRVVSHLRQKGLTRLRSQLVVFDNKNNYATAVDIYAFDAAANQHVIVELKYSSHKSSFIKNVYHTPGRNATHMRRCGLVNSIANQHAIQARATARLFCKTYHKSKASVRALVVVAPYSGPLLQFEVAV